MTIYLPRIDIRVHYRVPESQDFQSLYRFEHFGEGCVELTHLEARDRTDCTIVGRRGHL